MKRALSYIHSIRLFFCALIICLTVFSVQAEESYRLVWTWGILEHPEWCDTFQKAGINAVTIPLPENTRTVHWWKDLSSLDAMTPLLQRMEKVGVHGYVQIPLGMGPGTKFGSRTVTDSGFEEPLLACPLNEDFWRDYLIPAVSAIARKSLETPALKGVILDTEQYYGKEHSGALNQHYCFCDDCFQKFLKNQNIKEALPAPADRLGWLEDRQLTSDYWSDMEARTKKYTEELARAVQSIAPQFQIHFYIFDNTWFYRGLLSGLRELNLPVMVCDEQSYNGFLKVRATEVSAIVRELHPRAIWSPGFYTEVLNPRIMKANIRIALGQGDSYWIYNTKIPFPFDKLIFPSPN